MMKLIEKKENLNKYNIINNLINYISITFDDKIALNRFKICEQTKLLGASKRHLRRLNCEKDPPPRGFNINVNLNGDSSLITL